MTNYLLNCLGVLVLSMGAGVATYLSTNHHVNRPASAVMLGLIVGLLCFLVLVLGWLSRQIEGNEGTS